MATTKGLTPPVLGEVMTRGVETIHPSTTIEAAAEKMKVLNIGAIPVCDGNRLEGVLTGRDIQCRVVASHRNPVTVRASGDIRENRTLAPRESRAGDRVPHLELDQRGASG